MSGTSATERRAHPRYPLPTSVDFFHGPTQRQFPARCADISLGGMLMYVPAATPVRTGQPVRVAVGAVSRPEFLGLGGGPLDATIVRGRVFVEHGPVVRAKFDQTILVQLA